MSKYKFIARLLTILFIVWKISIPCAYSDVTIVSNIYKNTTWTKDNGVIYLKSSGLISPNIKVDSGATLTIEEGVTVKFEESLDLFIYGSLIIKGTKERPVKFITGANFKSGGIQIVKGNFGSQQIKVEHVEFSYFSEAVKIHQKFTDTIIINNSTFRFNKVGIVGSTKNLFVDSCIFQKNSIGILSSFLKSENSTINNSIFSGNGTGVENNATAISPDFINCIFKENSVGIKYVFNSGKNPLIKNCQLTNNVVGISCVSGLPSIYNSEIIFNKKGIIVEGKNTQVEDDLVVDNWICENDTALINKGPGSIYSFTNNCWCENDLDVIKNRIFDFEDSGLLGVTEIYPITTDCKKDFSPVQKFGFYIKGKANLDKFNFLKDGVVLLYQVGLRKPIDMIKLESGYFNFTNIPKGKYKIYIIPNPAIYPSYLPTYHSDTIRNEDAHILNLTGDAEGLDITLNRILKATTRGVKEERKTYKYKNNSDADTYYAEQWFPETSSRKPQLNDVKNLTVFQHDKYGRIVDWKLTDFKGEVVFQISEEGEYSYSFERLGYTSNINIDIESDPVLLENEVVDGILPKAVKNHDLINYYPNPVKNTLLMETERGFVNPDIIIYDLNGIPFKPEIIVGENKVFVQVGNLLPGMYMIKYSSEGSSGVFKFIKN